MENTVRESGESLMKLLWITHRRLDQDLSSQSRHGIANALNTFGWDVMWMSPSGGDYHVKRSRILGFGHYSFNRSVRKMLRSLDLGDFDLAIVEWTAVSGSVQQLQNSGLPWILMDRSPPVSTKLIGWIQNLQYREAWNMARVFASGCAVKSEYLAENQPWSGKRAIVPAGVSVEDFTCSKMSNDPWAVVHGSISKERELTKLWSICKKIRFIGEGNDAKRLSKLGATVEGPYESKELAQRLAQCDVGVLHLPDRDVWRNASPLKVAEYAAAGLPVVASEVSGLEKFRNSEWIKLIPLGDDQACKDALEELLGMDASERLRIGKLARAEAEQSMTWVHCSEELNTLLHEVKR